MEDPYSILGVSRSASQNEIKKAYRHLAKKNHPDLNPGNKEAEKKFKSISWANDQIGTEEARAKYDQGAREEQMHREYSKSRSRHSYYNTQQDTGRYSQGFEEDFDAGGIFEQIFGHSRRGSGFERPPQDELYRMEVEFKEAALGGKKVISLPSGKNLEVTIPAGIEEGKKLKFKGMGAHGDVYVEIHIKPLQGFLREGRDVITELPLSIYEAMLGAEIQVPTLDGSIMLKIPPKVSTGTKLRIKQKGVGAGEGRGNQIVVIKIMAPPEVPQQVKESLSQLAKQYGYNPRASS